MGRNSKQWRQKAFKLTESHAKWDRRKYPYYIQWIWIYRSLPINTFEFKHTWRDVCAVCVHILWNMSRATYQIQTLFSPLCSARARGRVLRLWYCASRSNCNNYIKEFQRFVQNKTVLNCKVLYQMLWSLHIAHHWVHSLCHLVHRCLLKKRSKYVICRKDTHLNASKLQSKGHVPPIHAIRRFQIDSTTVKTERVRSWEVTISAARSASPNLWRLYWTNYSSDDFVLYVLYTRKAASHICECGRVCNMHIYNIILLKSYINLCATIYICAQQTITFTWHSLYIPICFTVRACEAKQPNANMRGFRATHKSTQHSRLLEWGSVSSTENRQQRLDNTLNFLNARTLSDSVNLA